MAMMLPVIAALLLLPVLLLGIVLFIVGLAKKKPAMWGSGIAIGVLGLLVLTVGAGMLMFFSVKVAGTQGMAPSQVSAVPVAFAAMDNSFYETTGVALPDGVSVDRQIKAHHSTVGEDGRPQAIMLHMSVPSDFDKFLAANFTKAQWSDVAPTFLQTGLPGDKAFLPSDSQLQAASLYVLTYKPDPDLPETFVTSIAHDANTQQAWAVSVEQPPTAE